MIKNNTPILLYMLCFNFLFLSIEAQENNQITSIEDTVKIKKGWSYGVLPTITYNSDLGFQYGGLIDFYNYGSGDIYPKYYERYYLEVSRFTRGNAINAFSFESNRLLKGRSIYIDLMYRPDEQYDFLGLNGYESVYNNNWETTGEVGYRSKMFYKNKTEFFRGKLDILNPINNKWSWSVGIEYFYYWLKSVDVNKYNEGRTDEEKIPTIEEMPPLWDRYVKWGLIDEDEKNGGGFLGLKIGLMYDTRDNWTNASKGIWTEAVVVYVPSFIGNTSGYLKLNIAHRQYFTILKNKLTFAYRIGYSGNIVGSEPYYSLTTMYNVMIKGSVPDGLGGNKTLRGVRRNRVVGNGEAFTNTEFRYKFWEFNLFKQYFYMAATAFSDAGMVVQVLPLKEKVEAADITNTVKYGNYAAKSVDEYFKFGAESLHISYGAGLKISMNENFVLGIDFGLTTNKQDGKSGTYVGLNYIF